MKLEQNTVRVRCDNKECLNNKRGSCIANYIAINKNGKCKEQCKAQKTHESIRNKHILGKILIK